MNIVAAITEERAGEIADCYDLAASPMVLRALTRARDEDEAGEIARRLLVGSRLAAGESLERLIEEGFVTDADLDDLDDGNEEPFV